MSLFMLFYLWHSWANCDYTHVKALFLDSNRFLISENHFHLIWQKNLTQYLVARVHDIYRERESIQRPITRKNTLRKVITQYPSSPKALTCLKFYKHRMWALFLYKVRLKIHNHHRIIFRSALSMWKVWRMLAYLTMKKTVKTMKQSQKVLRRTKRRIQLFLAR